MKRDWIPTLALAAAIVTAAVILSYTIMSSMSKKEQISVTGLAQVDFISDVIVWQGTFERKAMELNEAYGLIKTDADAVRTYLAQKGVDPKEVVIGAVEIRKSFANVPIGDNLVERFDGYLLTQTVKIESRNVDHIEMVSREISELLNTGLALQSEVPKYYYSKLKDLKIDLLNKASADGTERAKAIAVNAGGGLGKLYQASMGTFQITAPNSDEDYTWGGAFNTTSRKKTASITVKMDFLTR
ncbi:MAG: hypothetical protein RIR53_764 [Bacteroidota bacterium]